jgi:replicative DNA helicase
LESTTSAYQKAIQNAQQEATKLFAEKLGAGSASLGDKLNESVQLTHQAISGIESGIKSLNSVLENLANQQVVIQQVPRKGWFSRS